MCHNELKSLAPRRAAKIAAAAASVNFGWRGGAPNFFPAAAALQGAGWLRRRNSAAEGSTQKTLPCAERRVLSHHWSRSDSQCDLLAKKTKKKKKEKRKKKVVKWPFPRPPTSSDRSQSLHDGWPPVCIVLHIKFY